MEMNDILWPPDKMGPSESEGKNPEDTNIPLNTDEHGSVPGKAPKRRAQKLLAAPKRGWHWIRFKHSRLNQKQKIVVGVLLVFFLAGGMAGAYYLYRNLTKLPPYTNPAVVLPPQEPPKPTTEPSLLTGVEVALELNKRPVTGVMIENSPDARPQSGLKSAGVVFEAVAEGGITRFLVLFQEDQPDYIGPVRSARPYYLDWLLPFDASYAHVGGSPDAMAQIKTLGVRDLDQFANSGTYQRVSNRYAPHNVYTSMAKLDELNQRKGYTSSTFTGFARKKEEPAAQPTARSINVTVSSLLYNSHYDYDPASNSYLRSQGGKPHTDERAAAQLSPKVVLVLVMPRGIHSDGKHSTYATVGSGELYVFQDGLVTTGIWQKTDRKNQFTFTDGSGAPIKLNPGQTWITMVNAGGVSSAP